MSRYLPSSDSTPPCDRKCWEWVSPSGWRYTRSVEHCGHQFDATAGVWKWRTSRREERVA